MAMMLGLDLGWKWLTMLFGPDLVHKLHPFHSHSTVIMSPYLYSAIVQNPRDVFPSWQSTLGLVHVCFYVVDHKYYLVSLLRHHGNAGRGLQPRPKRLDASITFEILNVKNGVANPVLLVITLTNTGVQ